MLHVLMHFAHSTSSSSPMHRAFCHCVVHEFLCDAVSFQWNSIELLQNWICFRYLYLQFIEYLFVHYYEYI